MSPPQDLSGLSDADLQEHSLRALAQRLQVSTRQVHKERHRRGLSPTPSPSRARHLALRWAALVLEIPAIVVSRRVGSAPSTEWSWRRKRRESKEHALDQLRTLDPRLARAVEAVRDYFSGQVGADVDR